jgi:peptide/nickel transport system substrate-binding protein/oligopeptide transport system substrate-binding protein
MEFMDRKRIWFVLALVAAMLGVVAFAAACGGGGGATTTSLAGAVKGGTLNVYINEPVAIEPVDLEESEGTQVGQALFDSLTTFDYKTMEVLPAAAESWDVNDDATVWTFHLVKGAKFHDGTPVTAKDFIYSWNRTANPANKSNVSYHLAPVLGYDDVQNGKATEMSGLKALDTTRYR